MVCMGGPSITITWNPTAGHRIDSGTTVCCAQYITPWPLTHPCCAPAFFSFSVDCERRQRRERFLFLFKQSTTSFDIHQRYFSFYWLLWVHLSFSWAGLLLLITALALKRFKNLFSGARKGQKRDWLLNWYTNRDVNTAACWELTRNVNRCTFCPAGEINNGCDFVTLSCTFLEYHSRKESSATKSVKNEPSGAAKMEEELSLMFQQSLPSITKTPCCNGNSTPCGLFHLPL